MHFTLHPAREFSLASIFHSRVTFIFANHAAQQIYRLIKKMWSVFITIKFNGSINKLEENWEKPTFLIQDGGYLFTN